MSAKNWTTIDDIAEVFDGPHATPKKTDIGPFFLGIASLSSGSLNLSQSAHVSEKDFKKWTRRVTPQEGDVVFSYETRIGEAAIIPKGVRCCLGRRMGLLRPKRDKVIPEYLLYAYLAPAFQSVIKARTVHGSTVDRISLKELPDFPIQVPPIEEQKYVVNVLSILDEKAEINLQMNRNLEQIAQALFKSWFVEFEPVKAKMAVLEAGSTTEDAERAAMQAISGKSDAELDSLRTQNPEQHDNLARIAALFPSAMMESELGEIPEGWSVGQISDVATLRTRSIKPSDASDEVWEHYSIPAYDEGKYPSFDRGDEIKSNKYQVPNSAVLVSKLNPRFPRIWWPLVFNSKLSVCSTEFMPFVPMSTEWRGFVAGLVLSEPFQRSMLERVSGSTGSRQRAQPKEVIKMPVVLPESDLIEEFSRRVTPLFQKSAENVKESRILSELRDTLLPKLLSGELTLSEVEKEVPEAADV
ncbi:restriction endonuclease subunit S [Aquisalimonas lutea]|uniref:restriction endonuclease subunit S n=1 Tax=Aquisalimonas lutea TaxID=1327750 RepID=UPI0025B3F95B|nr:restriction endonuclease subunit S [Aquisalimonas lutea]MDN3519623.1 restriction endonuclease subunit S [Aquisalimonas lutea]